MLTSSLIPGMLGSIWLSPFAVGTGLVVATALLVLLELLLILSPDLLLERPRPDLLPPPLPRPRPPPPRPPPRFGLEELVFEDMLRNTVHYKQREL
jgi:hypothetical protein